MKILLPLTALVFVFIYLAIEGRRQTKTWQRFRQRQRERKSKASDLAPDLDFRADLPDAGITKDRPADLN